MSNCCGSDTKVTKLESTRQTNQNEEPKSFVGRYLHRLGKKEMEKNKTSSRKGCC